MANARETALLILYQIEYEGAYSNLALKKQLGVAGLLVQDKALATELVYGVIRRKLTLEYIISEFSSIKLKKISKHIGLILKLGIYQLLYMNKIPQSAAVNECVKLAKRYGHSKSAGFVNGILRNVIRNIDNLPMPENEIKNMSVKYSCPEWLVDKWTKDFGKEFACELMDAMNNEAGMCVRVNTLKTTRDEMLKKLSDAKTAEYSDRAIYCGGFDIAGSEEYKNGLITVQDEAAILAATVLSPESGETVMDMCAAPGGKSTCMAELMKNKGKILSFDIHEHKISLIEENAKRLGIDIISAQVADACVYNEKYKETADKILADVPCSGLGIIRRKPDIKWNRPEESNLPEIQYMILSNAARYLKPGGELVYSTCTLNREENEDVILRFLKENKNFVPVDIKPLLDEKLQKKVSDNGYITLYPNCDGTDGFFIAKLKKV